MICTSSSFIVAVRRCIYGHPITREMAMAQQPQQPQMGGKGPFPVAAMYADWQGLLAWAVSEFISALSWFLPSGSQIQNVQSEVGRFCCYPNLLKFGISTRSQSKSVQGFIQVSTFKLGTTHSPTRIFFVDTGEQRPWNNSRIPEIWVDKTESSHRSLAGGHGMDSKEWSE